MVFEATAGNARAWVVICIGRSGWQGTDAPVLP